MDPEEPEQATVGKDSVLSVAKQSAMMFLEIRRWLSSLRTLRLIRRLDRQHEIAKDKEKLYMRRKFVNAYFELHRSDRALTAAQKAQKDATESFLAWQTICQQADVRTDAPGQFESSQHVAS